jgi:hypothetical protein
MRRLPWDIVLALFAGLGVGLVYAWMIAPQGSTNTDPSRLRADFKDQYRSAIAAAYAATGNLPRAQARLSLLGDPDPRAALSGQAQRMLANGEMPQQIDQVAALARALEGETAATSLPVTDPADGLVVDSTVTLSQPPPDDGFDLTETAAAPLTPFFGETQPPAASPTLRTTQTLAPTRGAPFTLIAQDEVCDANLPDGLLQIIVLNSNRRQIPGVEIKITWEGGEEAFFTGLKPELGNGYADFLMAPNDSYTVQLAAGSEIASGLVAPACQAENGEPFSGGFKLTFQQP